MAMFGDTLRQARAYKAVTLKEAEQATRINRHHLAALEEENFGALPPLIYQRGIVRNYATYLDLDPNKLLAMFEEAQGATVDAAVVPATKPLDMPSHWAPNFAIVAFIVVMSAIVFAWMYSAYFAPVEAMPTVTEAVPTVTPIPTDAMRLLSPATEPATPKATTKTSTASPTPKATATEKPKATNTPEPTNTPRPEPTPTEVVAVAEEQSTSADAGAEEAPVEESEPAESEGATTISITAYADIYLSVTGDGVSYFEGTLAAGQTTGSMSADQFQVYTTNVGQTWIVNEATGNSFVMGEGEGELSFPLP